MKQMNEGFMNYMPSVEQNPAATEVFSSPPKRERSRYRPGAAKCSSLSSPSLNFWRWANAWFQASRKNSLPPRFQLYSPNLAAPAVSTVATASRNSNGIRSNRGSRPDRAAPPENRCMRDFIEENGLCTRDLQPVLPSLPDK